MPDDVRVFVPLTTSALALALDEGALPAGTAFAVTPALREWYLEADTEELDYVAMTSAAQASLRLVDADPTARRRRVVISADVAPDQVVPLGDEDFRDAVRLEHPVPLKRWRSAHVDGAEAEPDVAAAAAAVLEADLGSESAGETVQDALGHELEWFAVQELRVWLDLLDLDP